MKLSYRFLAAVVFVLLFPEPLGAQSQPVGMIVTTQGSVQLVRGGRAAVPRPAQLLYDQDQLTVSDGSVTAVYCPSSERITLSAGTSVTLGANQLEIAQGNPARSSLGRCALPQVSLDAASVERVGAVRVRESGLPGIPLYLGGRIRQPSPALSWELVEGAQRYHVSVRKAAGSQVWEGTVTDSRVQLPGGQSLAQGFYEWQVDALAGERIIATQSTRFEVRSESFETLPSDPLLALVTLQAEGYFSEAAALIRSRLQQDPGDQNLRQQLNWLYLEAGLKEAAERVLQ